MPITAEELRERAKQWLQPISADAPAGAAATVDPRYEFIRTEAAKMDSPTASGTVEWKSVVDQGSELLEQKSKDFIIATYVAYGLYSTRGLDGLVTGLTLLAETCEQFWPTMFPELKRIRGRVNAVTWFIERTCMLLPSAKVTGSDRAVVEALSVASKSFSTILRAKFESNAPAMGPLLEGIERLTMSLPAEAPPPPPPQAAPAPGPAPAAAPPPVAAPVAAAPVALASGPTAELASAGEVMNFLRETGAALARAGATLRRADSSDPLAYRLLRAGLWLPIAAAPPVQGGKTSVPAVPAALRTQFEKMAANAKWPELLEECESAMTQHRLWLDLQRYTFQTLSALGASHARARDAVLIDVAAFLRRLPTLPMLTYSDGEPFADAQTKMWLETDVLGASDSGGGGGAKPAAGDDLGPVVGEARALIAKGQAPDAIALLHGKVAGIAPASTRFRARLALAKLCVQGSQLGIAKAIFEGLDREVVAHGLDTWEPALAAEVLEGAVVCLRSIAKGGKPLPPEAGLMYDRLCRIDPAAAAKVGA